MSLRIAFDLDDTLLCPNNEFPFVAFPPPWLINLLGFEPLRQHSVSLFKDLRKQNAEIWIYTSSFRNRWYIRRLFWLYGIRLDGIVNGVIHKQRMKNVPRSLSKYPPAFGIDVLVDNSTGVLKEGQENNFEVIKVDTTNKEWHSMIREFLRELQ